MQQHTDLVSSRSYRLVSQLRSYSLAGRDDKDSLEDNPRYIQSAMETERYM